MTQMFRRQFLHLVFMIAMAGSAIAGDVTVTGAFARASATPVAKAGAAYLTLVNDGQEPDRLIGVSSEIAAMSHLHETKSENGVMSMSAVDGLDVPAGGKVSLQPGGLHVMMMGLKAPLKQGETFPLELTFEKAGKIVVNVPVGSVAASGPE